MFRILLVKDGEGFPDLEEKLRSKGFRVDVATGLEDTGETEADLIIIYTTPQRWGNWIQEIPGPPSCTSSTLRRRRGLS